MYKKIRDKKIQLAVTSFVLFFLITIVWASSTGRPGRTSLGNGQGCSCHGASSANVNVMITGLDTLETNEVAGYALSIVGGPAVKGGIDVASSGGSLVPISPGLRKDAATGDIVHSTPGDFTSGVLTYAVEFTAPSTPGTVTLAAVGNSVNDNGTNGGDEWNFAPDKLITIVSSTSIEDENQNIVKEHVLYQNYPNPFNPTTKINFDLNGSEFVNLSVYNAVGQKIRTLVNTNLSQGNHTVEWDSKNDNGVLVGSGIYYYILKTQNNTVKSRKMILQR